MCVCVFRVHGVLNSRRYTSCQQEWNATRLVEHVPPEGSRVSASQGQVSAALLSSACVCSPTHLRCCVHCYYGGQDAARPGGHGRADLRTAASWSHHTLSGHRVSNDDGGHKMECKLGEGVGTVS